MTKCYFIINTGTYTTYMCRVSIDTIADIRILLPLLTKNTHPPTHPPYLFVELHAFNELRGLAPDSRRRVFYYIWELMNCLYFTTICFAVITVLYNNIIYIILNPNPKTRAPPLTLGEIYLILL